jgi:hypothetical protein
MLHMEWPVSQVQCWLLNAPTLSHHSQQAPSEPLPRPRGAPPFPIPEPRTSHSVGWVEETLPLLMHHCSSGTLRL